MTPVQNESPIRWGRLILFIFAFVPMVLIGAAFGMPPTAVVATVFNALFRGR